MKTLEQEFNRAVVASNQDLKKHRYNPQRFISMFDFTGSRRMEPAAA